MSTVIALPYSLWESLGFAIPVLIEWTGEWLAYWRKREMV